MKRILVAVAVLGLSVSTAFADVSREDIKKLAAAGVSDEVIVAFIKANGPAPKLSADDLVDMKKGGVSDKVLEAMMANQGVSPRVLEGGPTAGGGGGAPANTQPSFPYAGTRETIYVDRPVYYSQPAYVPYNYAPRVNYVYCRHHSCYDSCGYSSYYAPSYYTPSYYSSSYYSSCSPYRYYSYPSWGFSYYKKSSSSGWGIKIKW